MEEVGLLSWMQSAHGRIVRLEVENYESTDWIGAIEEVQKMHSQDSELQADWAKNDADLVRIFIDTLDRALN
jgi:hypothetical protein